jgi:hypothetical protein
MVVGSVAVDNTLSERRGPLSKRRWRPIDARCERVAASETPGDAAGRVGN